MKHVKETTRCLGKYKRGKYTVMSFIMMTRGGKAIGGWRP